MSTIYRVELTERAVRDVRSLLIANRGHESGTASRWFDGLERAVKSLSRSPERCSVAPESRTKQVVRHLLYGRKPHVYRILLQVAKEQRVVFVLHIRYGARRSDRSGT